MKVNSATTHYQELVRELARVEQHKQHLKKLEEARQQFLHHTAQEAYHGHMSEFYSDMIAVYTDYIQAFNHDNL